MDVIPTTSSATKMVAEDTRMRFLSIKIFHYHTADSMNRAWWLLSFDVKKSLTLYSAEEKSEVYTKNKPIAIIAKFVLSNSNWFQVHKYKYIYMYL